MTKAIKIKIRDVYGEWKAYPVCEQAKLFADLAGTKTLTVSALRAIKALGYTVNAVDAFGDVCGEVELRR